MNHLSHLMNQLDQAANGGELDGLSSYEEVYNYATRSGLTSAQAAKLASEARNKPGVAAALIKEARGGSGARVSGPATSSIAGNVGFAANFVIKVQRITSQIAADLPFAIFGTLDAENGYRRALNGIIPAGVTLVSVDIGEAAGSPEGAVFTYDDGTNTDTVLVTCQSAPYPNIIQAMTTDLIQTNKVRMILSDSSRTQQFGYDLDGQTRNLWGTVISNPVNPDTFKSPEQYQAGIVDIDVDWKFDKQSLIVSKIIPVTGFSVNFSFMARRFDIHGAKGW